jgi:replicative DNA helicase
MNSNITEVEQAVLGAVFLDNEIMHEIAHLESNDFQNVAHQLIWKGMLYQYKNNKPVDYITMVTLLNQYKRLDDVGGITYITNLSSHTPSTANTKYYAKILKSESLRRKSKEAADKILKISQEPISDEEDFHGSIDKIITGIRTQNTGSMLPIKDMKQSYFDNLMKKDELIQFGFKAFDEWCGGVGKGWLYILAGRPSVGKTAKALQIALNIAKQNVGQVLIWSQEMNRDQVISRMLSNESRVNSARIRKKNLDKDEIETLKVTYDHLENLPLHIDDASGVSIEQITSTARSMRRQKGEIAAIVVDYLTIMKITQSKGETRSQSVGEVTRRAKWLAKELNCVFLMLAQLSREGAKEEPQLHHLRDSGEIEQDADVVEFLWHKEDETDTRGKVIQSHIAKGREIGTNKFKYLFKGWLQTYEDYE